MLYKIFSTKMIQQNVYDLFIIYIFPRLSLNYINVFKCCEYKRKSNKSQNSSDSQQVFQKKICYKEL